VLTEKLVELPNEIIAIEIDPELAARLKRFPIEIRNEDALEAQLPEKPFRAVGNLPYNVGTPILRRVIADRNFRRAVFMLQKEVAQRLVAKPGDEQYGFLTLYTAIFASARILMTLGSRSFYPPPKVDSAVVVLDPREAPENGDALIRLISAAFRMRRKKLINNLTEWPRDDVLRAMRAAGLDESIRAEQMTLEQFEALLECGGLPPPSHGGSKLPHSKA
jgi:16S rRNA (adenine1518-N6/adenine1519-N6)-dimethyltransferase